MPPLNEATDHAARERAYFIWEHEGRPHGRDQDHWLRAISEWQRDETERFEGRFGDEEKILAGRPDVNMLALLTKDVPGG